MIPKEYKIVHMVMCAQVLSNYISDNKGDKTLQGSFLNYVNNFSKKLIKLEKEYFDLYFKHEEDNTKKIYEQFDKYLKEVSTIPVWEMNDIIQIIEAYKEDRKSIIGISKKILKYKK